jgi:hypothetical protein
VTIDSAATSDNHAFHGRTVNEADQLAKLAVLEPLRSPADRRKVDPVDIGPARAFSARPR